MNRNKKGQIEMISSNQVLIIPSRLTGEVEAVYWACSPWLCFLCLNFWLCFLPTGTFTWDKQQPHLLQVMYLLPVFMNAVFFLISF